MVQITIVRTRTKQFYEAMVKARGTQKLEMGRWMALDDLIQSHG